MRPRRRDRVVGWIALTIVLAMAVSLALNMLFIELGGVWARPALDRSNLLREVASLTRVMDAAPPALRPRLAEAAASHDPAYRVRWTARLAELRLPEGIDLNLHDGAGELRAHLSRPDTRILVVQPDQWPAHGGQRGYLLAIQLGDGSWLAFDAPYRSWGLAPLPRMLISLGLVLISTLLVAAVATRRLARPLQAFTRAARRFGADMRAPPIDPQGPYELREATLAFNAMQARIQRLVSDRTQMLAAISHDLRAPLTRMRLRGEFIRDRKQQSRLFRDIDEMQAMINAALVFFRDDTLKESPTPFDLGELLLTLVEDYTDQGLPVRYEEAGKRVHVGRPMALKRALTNLIDNALKYAGAATVTLGRADGRILIRVCDRGPGLPEAQLEKVMEPFYRLEGSRNRSTGGVGLGLATARAVLSEEGGSLTLSNRPGGGLCATLTLPEGEGQAAALSR
ncbi:ATP-binding protein [Alloalcanivorax sp. C16-1]|uniref:ATP-binding protein n=1 Tax=Alloalcanivorax sp. C16-1 TaxID=3390051 RepID=UPI003970A1F7